MPLFDIILSGLEDREVGTVSGLLESFQSLGASLPNDPRALQS
jgi:hypothetical protein